jgi:putative membrane protein insertion efficiency factor
MLLRPSITAAAPLRSSRARSAPTAPSACAQCLRKRSAALEGSKRRTKEAGPLIVAASAAKPGFDDDDDGDDGDGGEKTSTSKPPSSSDPGSALPEDGPALGAALALLRFYRNSLSPLMPKSCRFLPSCSEFAQISYRRFGVGKGTVLTAWRLLRCNPLNPGRTFYDPPRWPPVGLEWAFGGGGGEDEEIMRK